MLPFVRSFSAVSKAAANCAAPATCASFSVAQFEHRLSSQASPMVSLAMTIPAGTRHSIDQKDSGSVAAYYKHAILQGTKNESRIALARKADLRPSPLEITQNRDLLCLSAHFHVNFLPDLMETFAQLVPRRSELEIEEALVQGPVREAALLDASIAGEDVRVALAEAAWMTAFRANHLYAQAEAPVSSAQLAAFHRAALARKDGFSLLLGVNESLIITADQLSHVIKAAGLQEACGKHTQKPVKPNATYFGGEVRIEDASRGANHALLAFSLLKAGVAEANFPANWILQSFLASQQQQSSRVYSSLIADASLHGVFFEASGDELKTRIPAFLASLKKFKLDEEAFKSLKSRAAQSYAHSLDSRCSRLLTFANQLALRGSFLGEAEMKTAIDGVSADQFAELLTEAVKKPTLVSKGALKELPEL